jgi:trk system potassium uptake protein TrkA
MKRAGRVLVIGLGQFGTSVARSLAALGTDVIALDRDERRVDLVADVVSQALVADATDRDVLAELRIDTLSAALNTIGDEFLEGSILTTALLRQLGAPRLIARATNDLHKRILMAIGADEIVEPEHEIGAVVARRLARSGLVSQFDLGFNMIAVEIDSPEAWIDQTLANLDLRRRNGITVVAVRRAGAKEWVIPDPADPFRRGDVLLALGRQENIDALVKETLS